MPLASFASLGAPSRRKRQIPGPPWRDRRGQVSPLRILALLASIAPALLIANWALGGDLGLMPAVTVLFYSGSFAIWLLLVTLAITPLRQVTGLNALIGIRRILGIAAFAYTMAHLVAYVVMRNGQVGVIAQEVATRLTVMIALVALVLLGLLASTSTDAAVKRLGAVRWGALHRIVYLATALAIAHYLMSIGSTGGEPYVQAGLFLWLMAWRGLQGIRKGTEPIWIAGLTLALALATAAFEAGLLWLLQGFDPSGTLFYNFSLDLGVSPAWWVLGTGTVLTILATVVPAVRKRFT